MPRQDWTTVEVDGSEMRAFVCAPDSDGPAAGIVVIQHGAGVDAFIQDFCGRLATEGYYAAAPDLYHRYKLDPSDDIRTRASKVQDAGTIADANATVDLLRATPLVDSERLGITGFCMGGRIVYMMACVNPAFRAAVAFYGGNTSVGRGDGPAPLERLKDASCPVLGFFGEDDPDPSPEHRRRLDDELTRHGKPHVFHSFRGAGHAYMDYTNPDRYNEDASRESWPIALSFLDGHLGAVKAV